MTAEQLKNLFLWLKQEMEVPEPGAGYDTPTALYFDEDGVRRTYFGGGDAHGTPSPKEEGATWDEVLEFLRAEGLV